MISDEQIKKKNYAFRQNIFNLLIVKPCNLKFGEADVKIQSDCVAYSLSYHA